MTEISCKNRLLTKQKGFTLVELLIVVGLMALAVGVTSDILLNLVRSFNKIQVFNEIEQQSNFVVQKLEKELRNAVEPYSPNSTTLTFEVGADTITYTVTDEKIRRTVNTDAFDITYKTGPGGTDVGGVRVSCPGSCFEVYNEEPKRVKYEFNFQQSQDTSVFSSSGGMVVYNYIVLRRTY